MLWRGLFYGLESQQREKKLPKEDKLKDRCSLLREATSLELLETKGNKEKIICSRTLAKNGQPLCP